MKGQQRGRADFDIDAFVAENFQTDFPWDKEIGSHQELDAFILKLRKQDGLHAWHDKVDRIKRVFEPRADTPPKPTHVYLVTLGEDGQSFWKFGITTKTSAKKRNSHYTDTHRWVEVPTDAMAVEMETHIGSIIQPVAPEPVGADPRLLEGRHPAELHSAAPRRHPSRPDGARARASDVPVGPTS